MNSSGKTPNKRILIVDDEADVLDFLRLYLESLGWEITTSLSTAEALELLAAHPHFLVITDIAMPDMDGYEFVGEIHKREHCVQIALMTGFGYNPNHTLVKLYKTEKYPCLFKPFNRKKLAEVVQNAWETYHRECT